MDNHARIICTFMKTPALGLITFHRIGFTIEIPKGRYPRVPMLRQLRSQGVTVITPDAFNPGSPLAYEEEVEETVKAGIVEVVGPKGMTFGEGFLEAAANESLTLLPQASGPIVCLNVSQPLRGPMSIITAPIGSKRILARRESPGSFWKIGQFGGSGALTFSLVDCQLKFTAPQLMVFRVKE
jgi:hypothetical protein